MPQQMYMKRCLELAINGFPAVMPNPMVGCVIVHENCIIGEGFHTAFGKPHAEVNAINSVENKKLLKSSILYVNLEPCSHHGKTPPCADLIIKHKIPAVVIASTDPNPQVAGQGIQKLKDAGIEVQSGFMDAESREMNARFNCFHEKRRPYIILKFAKSRDGFMATANKTQTWITNIYSQMMVHQWRGEEHAILVGKNTAEIDNPRLTNRFDSRPNPLRVVFDSKLELPESLHVFDKSASTLIINEIKENRSSQPEFIKIQFDKQLLDKLMKELYARSVQSLIVEGGAKTLQSFIDQDLWDEARVFSGSIDFHKGIRAPLVSGQLVKQMDIKGDQLIIYRNKQHE